MGKRWTSGELNAAKEMFAAGVRMRDIALAIKRPSAVIRMKLMEAGVSGAKREMPMCLLCKKDVGGAGGYCFICGILKMEGEGEG